MLRPPSASARTSHSAMLCSSQVFCVENSRRSQTIPDGDRTAFTPGKLPVRLLRRPSRIVCCTSFTRRSLSFLEKREFQTFPLSSAFFAIASTLKYTLFKINCPSHILCKSLFYWWLPLAGRARPIRLPARVHFLVLSSHPRPFPLIRERISSPHPLLTHFFADPTCPCPYHRRFPPRFCRVYHSHIPSPSLSLPGI